MVPLNISTNTQTPIIQTSNTHIVKHVPDDYFFDIYRSEYKKTRQFAKKWHFFIYFGFMMLFFHIPVDIVSICVGALYDIPGLVVKVLSFIWYTYSVCALNNIDNNVLIYLAKHRIYDKDELDKLNDYVKSRQLGIDIYGFKINGSLLTQIFLFLFNFILPILYALFANKLI